MNWASKITRLARPLGVAILNLWVSSLIPPSLMIALKAGTLAIAHRVIVSACLLVPSSPSMAPAMHVAHMRRALVPLATVLESPAPGPSADRPILEGAGTGMEFSATASDL